VDPLILLNRSLSKVESYIPNDKKDLEKSLKNEARHCSMLILWLDCDSEGERIAFEVLEVVKEQNPSIHVRRARFSAITASEIHQAMRSLQLPNQLVNEMVSARQEADLRSGVAFTRFLTLALGNTFQNIQAVSSRNGKKQPISYGPCQFPTLGLVVDRFLTIRNFIPQKFRVIELVTEGKPFVETESSVNVSNSVPTLKFEWNRGRIFDLFVADALYEYCVECATQVNERAKLIKAIKSERRRWKPLPLSTVEMQKAASRKLFMSSDQAMTTAEELYTAGFISYPRTETDRFNPSIDLIGLIRLQSGNRFWGEFANQLVNPNPQLTTGRRIEFQQPRAGVHDDGAHPPIHPTRAAPESGFGDALKDRLYEYITRRFLASCSVDAIGAETVFEAQIGVEFFTAKGLTIEFRGFFEVFHVYEKWSERELPPLKVDDELSILSLILRESQTEPPPLLSESDLISLMDQHGIGTDATIAQHIKNVQERQYVFKNHQNRFVPMSLGLALVTAFERCEVLLARPGVRSAQEIDLKKISTGEVPMLVILERSMEIYSNNFMKLQSRLQLLIDSVGEHFDHRVIQWRNVSETFSRCGQCQNPMRFREERQQHSTTHTVESRQLFCETCSKSLSLPRQGQLSPHTHTCPVCRYQVLTLRNTERGTEHTLCPYCYSSPPVEAQIVSAAVQTQTVVGSTGGFRCFSCPLLDTCMLATGDDVRHFKVCYCPICREHSCALIRIRSRFNPTGNAFEWRIKCMKSQQTSGTIEAADPSACKYALCFPKSTLRVVALSSMPQCLICRSTKLQIHWKPSMIPPGIPDNIIACIFCDHSFKQTLDDMAETMTLLNNTSTTNHGQHTNNPRIVYQTHDIEESHNSSRAIPASNRTVLRGHASIRGQTRGSRRVSGAKRRTLA